MKPKIFPLFVILGLLAFAPEVFAQVKTEVMVRAQAKDAKFIGTSIGGAKIYIRNAETGEILAEGITEGSTGDTDLIMKQPHERNQRLADENTAGFLATLDLRDPVFVTIEAYAPNNKKQARVVSSTQLWLLPGKHIKGDGIVLEVPGFVVDILSPQAHERIGEETSIQITANVILMCGCPVTEDGTWDANQYEVTAHISREGADAQELQLSISDKPSTFSAKTQLSPGLYEITISAYDPVTGNTGLDRVNFIVNEG